MKIPPYVTVAFQLKHWPSRTRVSAEVSVTRILVLASEQPPVTSGVARSVATLATELMVRGHEVDVRSANNAPRFVAGEFRFSGMAFDWPAIRRELSGYDVVNLHGPAPTISDAFLALLAAMPRDERPPLVYTHHSNVDIRPWGPACAVYNRLHRRLAHHADQVVVTTPSYAQLMAKVGRPHVETITWGVDAKSFDVTTASRYDGTRPLRVLLVGQMRPYKGVPVLIDAVRGRPEIEATVVGSGPFADKYRALAERTAPNVTCRGRVEDDELVTLLLDHDVLALPSVSRAEAFGLVLLEGMAAGCVPVASDLPGVRDIAGPTGVLVRAGDPTDLRRALLALAADPRRVTTLQRLSRRRAEQVTWDRVGADYERVLRATIARVRAARGQPDEPPQQPDEPDIDDFTSRNGQIIDLTRLLADHAALPARHAAR